MALANFFAKNSLSVAQQIKSYDRSTFEKKLLGINIAIAYGENATGTSEGRCTLDLLVRILARLYPNIQLVNLEVNENSETFTNELKNTALKINPAIDLALEREPDVHVCVGEMPKPETDKKCLHIGASHWTAFFSQRSPKGCHDSGNPFGAAAAACIAAANLFRFLFREELGSPPLDDELRFSVFSQTVKNEDINEPVLLSAIKVDCTLVGTGAIGNATLWCLRELKGVFGTITIIDDQTVDQSNLQRYALMFQEHVRQSKVDVLKAMIEANSALTVQAVSEKWQNAASSLTQEQLTLVATAIDSEIERLQIQSILPKKILNAWTSPACIGVSRHLDFMNKVCLSCLYIPAGQVKSESQKIAESLGIEEPVVRKYLANHLPIDPDFIHLLLKNPAISHEHLAVYLGHQVQELYSEGICGGKIIKVEGERDLAQSLEVPLAHESIMAGVLLGAEIVIEMLGLRSEDIPELTKINLSQPLHEYLLENEAKHYSGRCICQDEIFQTQYRLKWSRA